METASFHATRPEHPYENRYTEVSSRTFAILPPMGSLQQAEEGPLGAAAVQGTIEREEQVG
jgi:hypothetical protein